MTKTQQFWDLATTTSVASVWLARQRWLPRQAKLTLHGDWSWRRTREKCMVNGWHGGWHRIKATSFVTQHKAGVPCGVQLEKDASGPELSNQQSEKQSLANTKQSWRYLGKLVATYNFATSLFCTNICLGPFRPWSPVAVPNLQFLRSLLCCRDLVWNGPNKTQQPVRTILDKFGTLPLQHEQWLSCDWQN